MHVLIKKDIIVSRCGLYPVSGGSQSAPIARPEASVPVVNLEVLRARFLSGGAGCSHALARTTETTQFFSLM